ncbi:hypothetical protein PVOR_16944 [Paenibacillus vortex V453]|uniref:Uncharacterized protein n=1 Tax=Paenibacillus vortex V453 TaxID=715225 RepID=A0A2R9ST86_9BACL|nr:hypothetical protein PVOR_16944 [Paenibacillus vortex V453]
MDVFIIGIMGKISGLLAQKLPFTRSAASVQLT